MTQLTLAIEALQAAGLAVQEVSGTLNVVRGRGPTSRRSNIDPLPLLEWLGERQPDRVRQDVASWAHGVQTALMEPARSLAQSWTFTDAAGSLLPMLTGPGFGRGVAAANGGDPAWTEPLDDDVHLVWAMHLGRGVKVVTHGVVERWDVNSDRIRAAARSMLFHSTRDHRFSATDSPPVEALRVGDGCDAARIVVVADAFFTEVDARWRFALPTSDLLLAVRHDSAEALTALQNRARVEFESSAYPLSTAIWVAEPKVRVA